MGKGATPQIAVAQGGTQLATNGNRITERDSTSRIIKTTSISAVAPIWHTAPNTVQQTGQTYGGPSVRSVVVLESARI